MRLRALWVIFIAVTVLGLCKTVWVDCAARQGSADTGLWSCGEDGGEPRVYTYIGDDTIIGTPVAMTELHVYRPEEWDGGSLSVVVVHYLDGGTCSCPVNGGDR